MVLGGLDIATTTGVAVLNGDRLVLAAPFHWEGKFSGAVFRNCRKTLYELIGFHKIEHMAAEEPLRTDIEIDGRANDNGTKGEKTRPPMRTFQRIYGLCAVAEEVCEAHGIPFEYVHQGTWRKAFTGSGSASKELTLSIAQQIDRSIVSKDAAEALGVVWWLRGHLNPRLVAARGDLFEAKIQSANPAPATAPATEIEERPF